VTDDGRPPVPPSEDEPLQPPPNGQDRGASRPRLNEDWAATIVGLALLVLVLAGVITKGMIP
jgi:hypothetical protein